MINPYIRAATKFPEVKQQAKERFEKRKGKPDKPIVKPPKDVPPGRRPAR